MLALDNQTDALFAAVRRDLAMGHLQLVSYDKGVNIHISDYVSEYDFPEWRQVDRGTQDGRFVRRDSAFRSRIGDAAYGMTVVSRDMLEDGWTFAAGPDPLSGCRHLHELYAAADPNYTGPVTVPVLWDSRTRRIVNNESSEIIRMLNRDFDALGRRRGRPLSSPARCGNRPPQRAHLRRHQQRRLPRRVRDHPGRPTRRRWTLCLPNSRRSISSCRNGAS